MELHDKGLATFGGGCFWCVEAVFKQLKGVEHVEPGYSGGKTENPTYKEVCNGTTGHAEVVRIEFNPNEVSFNDLLEVFFKTHDPTQLNRQGNDVGTQYRSVVFYHSEDQKQQALGYIESLKEENVFDKPIVTLVEPIENYYVAENYHHDYFANNPSQPYCEMVVNPKVQKFKREFAERLK